MPSDEHPGILFVDMNAYFASVEQMDRPELRGKPVAVTPVLAASGCCIASSYEARAAGVKTGCRIAEARRLCPSIEVVRARPDRYVRVHHELLAAIDTAVPVSRVESVDECWCRLAANERPPGAALAVAHGIKRAIASRVGPLTCSIGIAPNRLLAKIAAGMRKPDGLTVVSRRELPGPLLGLSLTDLPGISKGINRRLRSHGIHTVSDLYACSAEELRAAWGSVVGVYWWHWLRGDDLDGPPTRRRTVGHQHVLAPEFRAPEHARGVSVRLLSKAAQRMRSLGYCAGRLSLGVRLAGGGGWGDWSPVAPATCDTAELQHALRGLWRDAPGGRVLQVGVRLEDLEPADRQLALFGDDAKRRALMDAVDRINLMAGADAVYFASMHGERRSAPRRIPFGTPPDLALPDHDGSSPEVVSPRAARRRRSG